MRILMTTAFAAMVATGGGALANDGDLCFDKETLSYAPCEAEQFVYVPDWTGFYIGLHAGVADPEFGGVFDSNDPVSGQVFGDDITALGATVGGQVGYLHHFANDIVVGVEIDGSAAFADGDAGSDDPGELMSGELDFLASARLRAGYAIYDVMPYVTGGVAVAGYETTVADDSGSSASFSETVFGGVVGGGVEFLLDDQVTLRGEMLYYIMDDSNALAGVVVDADAGDSVDLNGVFAGRVALNWRF